MLHKLLDKLAAGGVHSYADLSRELDVSEGLLEQMLIDLERLGYLKRVGTDCEAHCAGCPMNNVCAAGRPGQIWTLTEKGGQKAGSRISLEGEKHGRV
ncbi:MAG: FeoC-like transcriptional regulator [Anaerolineae bacterium]|jgi:DNA-binding Lrp family transcriptional regulator|nr:FeoC-like transcriptional regulator [Anaerolineae bacterium]MDH7474519.1 FeoC-like transcriptional regulator [Anaerolineae bacterium]